MKRTRGFTLIELLVVIAVIAVLMAILMPSLNRAREQAKGVTCLNNQKSMALAYIMYADENDGRVCGGFARYGDTNKVPAWVKPPMAWAGSSIVEKPQGDVSLQERLNGLMAGAIYPYLKDTAAYHCPGDNRQQVGTSRGNSLHYAIYRSYGLADYMRATEAGDEKVLSAIKNASKKMMFVEDIYDGSSSANFNHDGWSYEPGTQMLWDPLGVFHSDSCSFSFMDGHAEMKRWSDNRTVIFFESRAEATNQGFGKGQQFNPHNNDLDWLDEHYPGKNRFK